MSGVKAKYASPHKKTTNYGQWAIVHGLFLVPGSNTYWEESNIIFIWEV